MDQNGEGLETISMGGGVTQVMLQGGEGAQVLQVLSLKDATVLTKAMVSYQLLLFFSWKYLIIIFTLLLSLMKGSESQSA